MKMPSLSRIGLALVMLLPTGCFQQWMAAQPKIKPLQPTTLFKDGQGARPLEFGTVSRSWRDDPTLLTGRKADAKPFEPGEAPADKADEARGKAFVEQFAAEFPMPVDRKMIERGQSRYNIFCSVCHGYAGSGDGMIVQRGFTKPPSLVHDSEVAKDNYSRGIGFQGASVLVPDAPVGYYFHVMTNGFGAMPEHATQIPAEDRWAIASYLRALQASQRAKVTDEIRKEIDAHKKKEGGAH